MVKSETHKMVEFMMDKQLNRSEKEYCSNCDDQRYFDPAGKYYRCSECGHKKII